MSQGQFSFFDKDTIPTRTFTAENGVRIVPGGSSVRRGAYLAPSVIMMPPAYVNIGAYVDEGTMIDSHDLSVLSLGVGLSKLSIFIWVNFRKLCFPKILFWRRKWQPTPVFLPGESRGQKSLVGHSLSCHKESHDLLTKPGCYLSHLYF